MKIKIAPELTHSLKKLYQAWFLRCVQVAAAMLLALSAVFFWNGSFGTRLEMLLLQQFFYLRGPVSPPSQVVIVRVDDKSFQELGVSTRSPMPRMWVAKALKLIAEAQPRLLILDAGIAHEPQVDPVADDSLEEALKLAPSTIWNGHEIGAKAERSDYIPTPAEARFRNAAKMELPMTLYGSGGVYGNIADSGFNKVNLFQRVPMARALVELGGYEIKLPESRDLINFYGGPSTIQGIPLYQVIRSSLEQVRELIENKVVLVGYQSNRFGRGTALKDEFAVPSSNDEMFGVEIHATVIGNLLTDSWLKRLPLEQEVALIGGVVFVLASFVLNRPKVSTIFGMVGITSVLIITGFTTFSRGFWIAGVTTVGVYCLVISAIAGGFFFWRTERYRQYIDKVFNFERTQDL